MRDALAEHLTGRGLSVRWVACLAAVERVEGARVYRCNVNFGDPHIQIYCATLLRGRLLEAEWRQAVHGVQNRVAAARECAARLRAGG